MYLDLNARVLHNAIEALANKIYPAISFFSFSQKTVGEMC